MENVSTIKKRNLENQNVAYLCIWQNRKISTVETNIQILQKIETQISRTNIFLENVSCVQDGPPTPPLQANN